MVRTFASYEELVAFIRNWRSWGSTEGEYDVVGLVHLLGACLTSLSETALDAELADFGDCLDDQQKIVLAKLATITTREAPDL